ncbi:Voltage-dependent T-type calcium channel subunit alpha-1H [Toxocara canis]|uniref:Voltage-dependent T-type calcium channel subunit alpha-1H n=1 Tax=Toxocara canis TaxID=6265 RepID=A0A0B2UQ91_TOXCA|nr:Voltage-dependent T-type calcium channel subunit alpha-1H [Toxocara canis]
MFPGVDGEVAADSFVKTPLARHGSSLSSDLSSGEESDVEDADKWSASEARMSGTNVRQNHRRSIAYNDNVQDVSLISNGAKKSRIRWLRERIQAFVICNHFKRGILFAILINTLSMGVEYHQQPELLTTILEYSNYFFTGLFALEMLLKIIADGLFGYLSDGFNLFDGGIVALRFAFICYL